MSNNNNNRSATDLRVHLGQVLDQVRETGEAVTIERDGRPVAVLLSVEEYQRMQRDSAWHRNAEAARRVRERIAAESPAVAKVDFQALIDEGRHERDRDLGDLR